MSKTMATKFQRLSYQRFPSSVLRLEQTLRSWCLLSDLGLYGNPSVELQCLRRLASDDSPGYLSTVQLLILLTVTNKRCYSNIAKCINLTYKHAYTYIHSYRHTYLQTYVHTYIQTAYTYSHACIHSCIQRYIQTHINARMRSDITYTTYYTNSQQSALHRYDVGFVSAPLMCERNSLVVQPTVKSSLKPDFPVADDKFQG